MYSLIVLFACMVVSVTSHYDCDYPSYYDFSSIGDWDSPGYVPDTPVRVPPSSYHRPTYDRPTHDWPHYHRPTHHRPTYDQPPYSQTTHAPPIHSPPSYTSPTHNPPTHAPSTHTPPSQSPPTHAPTTQSPSTHTLPTYDLPSDDLATNDQQIYEQPKISESNQDQISPIVPDAVSPQTTTTRRTSPLLNPEITFGMGSTNVLSRVGEDFNNAQQTQMSELQCLEVLDNLISTQWQEEINQITVNDLANFSTTMKIPPFKTFYSNPESEWIQDEEMVLNKLDKCVRNLVSKTASRMDQDEIQCLNRMYPDYLTRENATARLVEMYISETSREQLPFRSFYTYFEITQLLFDNKNIDALDDELRAVHEDILEFYIKTEEDKTKKIFIIDQECEWKNARVLREVNNEDTRYRKFGEQVKSHVNEYLVSEILQKWVPGVLIPESTYNMWSRARQTMETEIQEKIIEVQNEKRDAQFLCTYAAELANKFFLEQKEILFKNMKNTFYSFDLKTREKYSYVAALEGVLMEKNDERISRVSPLVKEFKEGHYCLTNFVRMIENHQRYMIATALVNEMLPYGSTYCHVKEMSAGLINPRYCKCRGTFCEEFGLATIRREHFQLNLLANNTYSVSTNSSYRPLPLDELVGAANQRIAGQKFNTWWYRHQKTPA